MHLTDANTFQFRFEEKAHILAIKILIFRRLFLQSKFEGKLSTIDILLKCVDLKIIGNKTVFVSTHNCCVCSLSRLPLCCHMHQCSRRELFLHQRDMLSLVCAGHAEHCCRSHLQLKAIDVAVEARMFTRVCRQIYDSGRKRLV